ncbi:MAG: hypothetical protein K6F34_01315 [Lachnospiraceae bacterium]|nr:hypothetical protein [Lachnospiraceae bacterium]
MKERVLKSEDLRIILYIMLMFVVSRTIMYLIYRGMYGDGSIMNCIHGFNIWDAEWYEGYAKGFLNGQFPWNYDGATTWAFFPLFPLMLAVAYRVLHFKLEILLIGTIVSNVCFLLAEYIAYKYIMLTRRSIKVAYAFITFMSLGLYAFYYTITYTEALYLFFLVLSFYFMKKEQYIFMGISGAFLSATRNTGVMFVFAILIWRIMVYVKEKGKEGNVGDFIISNLKNEKLVLGTVMVPAGIFAYILFLIHKTGDGFAFVHVQKVWGRDYKGFFNVLVHSFRDHFPPDYLGLFTFVSFLLILYLIVRYKNFDEMFIPVIVLLMGGSSSFMSMPRFMIGSFSLVLGFAEEYAKMNKVAKVVVAAGFFAFELVLIEQWVTPNSLLW